MLLHTLYATCGTEVVDGGTLPSGRKTLAGSTQLLTVPCTRYAMSGTGLAHIPIWTYALATRCPVPDVRY
eukprot:3086068-Rhodomonas_salina.2